MGKIIVTGTLTSTPADLARIGRHLPEHARLSRAEPGCLHFEVGPSPDDPHVFILSEAFVDAAAFEAHKTRTQASEWPQHSTGLTRDIHIREEP